MKYPDTTTYPPCDRAEEQRFRNQATGIGQTRQASASVGAARSQAVINAAPASQRKCADDSYPDPTMTPEGEPIMDKDSLWPVVTAPIQGRLRGGR